MNEIGAVTRAMTDDKKRPKRTRGCRRADGLCKLTEEQKAARDHQMRAWLNQRRIHAVARASGFPNDQTHYPGVAGVWY